MKLFTRYLCDQTGAQFDVDAEDEVPVSLKPSSLAGASSVARLLDQLGLSERHFLDLDARTAYLSRFPWDELQQLVDELKPQPREQAPDSGPPAERIRRTPKLAQLIRGVERPDELDPPIEPLGEPKVAAGKGPYVPGPDRPNQPDPADSEPF